MAGHRTSTDKIFTNFDEDLSCKPCDPTHCHTDCSSSSNNEKTSGYDMIYTNSPTRQYPPPLFGISESIAGGGGCIVPYIHLLKHLDPGNVGYVSVQCLLGYFDKLGVLDTGKTLEYLGIVGQEDMLELNIVIQAINDHISNLLCYDKYSVYAATTALLCDQITISQRNVGSLVDERDKLTEEMQDMHTKVNEMSKQINGIHYQHDLELQQKLMSCEQSWKEKLKCLEQRTKMDCNAYQSTIEELKRNSEMTTEEFESIKISLKNEIDLLKQNNKKLENKIEEMKINLLKMEDLNSNLKSEIQKSKVLNERLITIENCSHRIENDASAELIKNLEELMKVNQALKDRNDELEINMLNIPLQQKTIKEDDRCSKRKNDYTSESSKLSPKIKWSKKSEMLDIVESNASLSDECDELLSLSDVDCNLDVTGGNLEHELDHVKMEIMKMITEKKQAAGGSTEAEKVKKFQTKAFQLEQENKKLKQTIQDLHHSMKLNHKDPHQQVVSEVVSMPDIVVEQITSIDRSSPDGQEREEENHHSCNKEDGSVERIELLETSISDLKLSNSKLLDEKKHLEESLDLIQSEFESMEDYWQGKIFDERKFYEEQVKVSESQFKELEVRMKEYEELLIVESSKCSDIHGRLETIDEDRNMEEKVTAWEEEITHLHNTIEELEVAHEQELGAMKQKLSHLESKQCKCGKLSVKRKNLETFWMKVVKSDSGPLSLPSVVLMREDPQHNRVDDPEDPSENRGRQDVFTQVPNVNEINTVYENSLCSAYRAILSDITREIQDLRTELDTGYSVDHNTVIVQSCVQSRLSHITSRCYQLQYNLHQTRGHCANNITVLKEQHESEMSQLESLVITSQELLGKQSRKFIKELDKLVMTDITIKHLIDQNDDLTQTVNQMKQKFNISTKSAFKGIEEEISKEERR